MEKATYRPAESDRRPLSSRQWRLSIALASWLAKRGVRANAVSTSGMAAGILAGLLLTLTNHVTFPAIAWLCAAALVQGRLMANLLDGMVAIESGQASRVGELFNEVPDRISDAATFVGLGYSLGGAPWLGYSAAILAIFVAYVRAAVRVAGGPQDYCGPMAKQHRMAVVTATCLACALVPAAWQSEITARGFGLPTLALGVICLGSVVTAVRRLARGTRALMVKSA
jgi:phosphatidylglycerophosphate synthase